MLLSTGERIACALVAMAIHDLGEEAVSLTGSQAGILTDAAHNKAKIREIRADRVHEALAAGKIVLVAGFQGFSRDTMEITTLGRGGTDATAVALAAALHGACEIYSDVPGVFTADPRIVPGARKLPHVSYEEMLEMSAAGAKVLMLRSVELARNHGVRVHARSTFSDEDGTWIQEGDDMEEPMVTAVTHSETDVVFTLTGIPDRPGVAALVFDTVAAAHVNVDTIIQNTVHGKAEMSFSVPAEDVPATRRAIEETQRELGTYDVEENHGLGKVSLIGAGMRSHPGVAAKMFRTLADLEINLQMISTSPIRISCMIEREAIPRAVRGLHEAFELDREPEVEQVR
jgi:aspartate kinase